jgi:type II secretory pathway predicted ATPase ExeA
MSADANLYLVVYHHGSARSEVEELGGDVAEALRIYEEREREVSDDDVEIVLLGSESLATLKQTHSSYFGAGARLKRVLSGTGA